MVVAYIRPDKYFEAVHEQLQLINSYAISNNILIDDEFIDQLSTNKRLIDRTHVTNYFQNKPDSTLLIYDVWVLSSNVEDLVQMFSCLFKNNFCIHFIKQGVTVSSKSNVRLVLSLIDQLSKQIQNESKKVIGRPKVSRSSSKFDKYLSEIMTYLRDEKSVSEMARLLGVSRSSLKDYIESRELKQVVVGSLLPKQPENAEENVINSFVCPI